MVVTSAVAVDPTAAVVADTQAVAGTVVAATAAVVVTTVADPNLDFPQPFRTQAFP
ncbi:MAG: hypothetical protein INR62_04435 [Rhodospirillales bacterium]|nr:hypothetical protein [Acetobacter sp.]